MSHAVWFYVTLICGNCGAEVHDGESNLHTPGLLPDPVDRITRENDLIEAEPIDFPEAYFEIGKPEQGGEVRALEQWSCPICNAVQWARLEFRQEDAEHFRFIKAQTVALTPEILRHMHYASRRLEFWVQDHPGPESDRLREVLGAVWRSSHSGAPERKK